MRPTLWILLLVALAPAQDKQKDPFRSAARVAKGPEGRIAVKVPAQWRDAEIAGNMAIRVLAPGSYGGHDLRVEREEGQSDVDRQRDRYLQYDSGNAPAATVQKLGAPFFGYRLNDPDKNRVLIRAFLSDGADGLVITVSSRFQSFDKLWRDLIYAIVASVSVSGEPGTNQPEREGELRRLFDPSGRLSIVAPSVWKRLTPKKDKDLLFVALKGAASGPRFTVTDWGDSNAGLTLLKISGRWKKTYGNIVIRRLGNDPPRMLVRNRIPGSVDYIFAFDNAGHGTTLSLTVREGSFEKFKSLADEIAKTFAFTNGPYTPPQLEETDITHAYKSVGVVHASVEQTNTADEAVKVLATFQRHWSRIGVGFSRKAAPLHIVVAAEEDFGKESHYFGRNPAAYDRAAHVVVVTPRPAEKDALAMWRGRLLAALAENALQRDLPAGVPPWLRAGLRACMEAAGRGGKSPESPHPAYVTRLVLKTATDAHRPLSEILAMNDADVDRAESPDLLVQAWGYTHLMLYGKGALPSYYRRWSKALAKARGKAPAFRPKAYDRDRQDLARHVFKRWENK